MTGAWYPLAHRGGSKEREVVLVCNGNQVRLTWRRRRAGRPAQPQKVEGPGIDRPGAFLVLWDAALGSEDFASRLNFLTSRPLPATMKSTA